MTHGPSRCLMFGAFLAIAALACATAGLTRTSVAAEANALVQVTALDGNPQYLDGLRLPLDEEQRDGALGVLTGQRTARRGAAADGVSLLVLRAALPGPGTASFTLAGKGDRGALGTLDDLSARPQRLPARMTGTGYAAFALYRPPAEFGEEFAGPDAFSRTVTVRVAFAPQQGEPAVGELELRIVRPPLVLAHGMFHNPRIAWQTQPPDQDLPTITDHLRARGFRVFLVDYGESNGRRASSPSHLRDNQRVLWENPGGIKAALAAYRNDGYAATQADVVGHSMGGLLARAYAKGSYLPDCEHTRNKQPADAGEQAGDNWYLREDNFGRGDIHRLITVCTAHEGSHLVTLLRGLSGACDRAEKHVNVAGVRGLLRMLDFTFGLDSGAFADQQPESGALESLGPTRVPAHAVACTADAADYAHYNGRYRWPYLSIYLLSPVEVITELFEDEGIGQPEAARALAEFVRQNAHLREGIMPRALAALAGRVPQEDDEMLRGQYNTALRLFTTAVFRGEASDGAVGLRSAHGGLARRYTTTIPHVIHSYAARYAAVQTRLTELLEGPSSAFDPQGFPAPGERRDMQPGGSPQRTRIPADEK